MTGPRRLDWDDFAPADLFDHLAPSLRGVYDAECSESEPEPDHRRTRMDTDVIYRVIFSPTSHQYAVSTNGVDFQWYASYKQAARHDGHRPLKVISAADFEKLDVKAS